MTRRATKESAEADLGTAEAAETPTPKADAGDGTAVDPSVTHLLGRLAVIELAARRAVARRRGDDPTPDDPFRGLYLTPGELERLLGRTPTTDASDRETAELRRQVESAADDAAAGGSALRLRRLGVLFGLDELDLDILLVALAPDADSNFEKLYGYLHDDVTRRRASVGLALELTGVQPLSASARRRLAPGAPLVDGGLVEIEPENDGRPFLTRALRVPDRVAMHLLGDDRPDPLLRPLFAAIPPCLAGDPAALSRAMAGGAIFSYLQERSGASGRALAAAAFARLNLPAVALDLGRLAGSADPVAAARAAVREARLLAAGLVAGPVEELAERSVFALRELAEHAWLVALTGSRSWDPDWSTMVPLVVEVPALGPAERDELWRASLDGAASSDLDPAEATRSFSLGPEQIGRAVQSAWLLALHEGRPLEPEDLRAGARSQNVAGLERMAHRIHPSAGWDDIVLPSEPLTMLKELAARLRLRARVYDEWGMREGGRKGDGITALFAGSSGTGKTMAAEVIAHELGLDLYAIDLATVVDKYIGETEKNLERVFGEAERVNGVLFFDEADALFGKRSEVRDAHDRYANVEVAYLLQRMESFNGMAVLATNLRSNLDDAFARRLDAVVEFPVPDEPHRRRIWERCLSGDVPVAEDVDLDFAAKAFELTGGNIRNITLAAAFLAADQNRPVEMADLIRGTQREYRKLGRLCVEAEFGPYYGLLTS